MGEAQGQRELLPAAKGSTEPARFSSQLEKQCHHPMITSLAFTPDIYKRGFSTQKSFASETLTRKLSLWSGQARPQMEWLAGPRAPGPHVLTVRVMTISLLEDVTPVVCTVQPLERQQ